MNIEETKEEFIRSEFKKVGLTLSPDQDRQIINYIIQLSKSRDYKALTAEIIRYWRDQPEKERKKPQTMLLTNLFLNDISKREAFRMVYFPLLTIKTAFRFALDLCCICASRRLPYVKQTRIIKSSCVTWEQNQNTWLNTASIKDLEARTASFLEIDARNINCLWWVINQELKRLYPDLTDEYDILTDLYACISLLDFALAEETASINRLSELKGEKKQFHEPLEIKALRDALQSIASQYSLDTTDMIKMAIKAIENRLILSIFENNIEQN